MKNSSSHGARHDYASPSNCPQGYLARNGDGGDYCLMRGVVTVTLNGAPHTYTWWSDSDVVPEQQSVPVKTEEGATAQSALQ